MSELPPSFFDAFLNAMLLQSGYNATLVMLGSLCLGMAAGSAGVFLFLRKRALVSDALAHATLPGIGLAFIVMVFLGGDGRNLIGLTLGALFSAMCGLFFVQWISRYTRLGEDVAIGAVLSVLFGFGVVLLTLIQTMESGRQAGLESFLLGSAAAMLFEDAVMITIMAFITLIFIVVFARILTIISFDPDFSNTLGVSRHQADVLMMGLVLIVTVIGLKIVGLILILALLIIPPVTARFWSERTVTILFLAGLTGGLSSYIGTALSVSAANMPTGAVIVLVCFGFFVFSFFFAPKRGLLAGLFSYRTYQILVHRRQGLLAIARGELIYDRLTLSILKKEGLLRSDHAPTEEGRALASNALLDEQRWQVARQIFCQEELIKNYDSLCAVQDVFTKDQIAFIDNHIPALRALP
jgi:manganese/zinc/iron transport system permease protein